jgi:hypothetical protein
MKARLAQAAPWALLILLAAGLMHRPLFLGEAIGPFDSIRAMHQAGEANTGAFDVLQTDGALQFYGWRGLVLESWSRFEPPFWNPHQLMGTPLMANSQSGAFYPPHIVLGVASVPLNLAMALLAWGHLAWAALGVMLLARRLGAPMPGAWLAGASTAVSPFLLAWMPLASVPSTSAWMPWLWAMAYTVGCGKWRLATVGAMGVCGGMMILAGHLQFAAYGFIGAFLFLMAGLIRKAPPGEVVQRALGGAIGLALAFGLAAPQLLPVLEFSQFSHRATAPTAEAFQGYLRGSLQPHEMLGIFFMPLMGEPGQAAQGEGLPQGLGLYWPAYARIGAAFAEGALAWGPAVLALLALAGRHSLRRGVIASAVVVLVGLLLALGTPLNGILYFGAPGWAATGSPSRALVIAVLAAMPLAALMWPEKTLNRKRAGIAAGVVVLVAVICMGGVAAGSLVPDSWIDRFPIEAIASQAFLAAAPRVMIAVVCVAGGLALLCYKRPWAAAGVLAAAQLLVSGPQLMPTSASPPRPQEANPMLRQAWINEGWGLLEAAPDAFMPPNLATPMRLYDAAGYDSLVHRDTAAWFMEVNQGPSSPEANGNIFFIKPTADPAKLAESGVTKVTSKVQIPALGEGQIINGLFTYQLEGPGRFSSSGRPIEVLRDGLQSQLIKASGPSTLTIRDRMMPGWRAWVGSQEVDLDPAARWRTIEVPDGVWMVSLRYDPPGLQNGLMAGGVSLVLLIILIFSSKPVKKVHNIKQA